MTAIIVLNVVMAFINFLVASNNLKNARDNRKLGQTLGDIAREEIEIHDKNMKTSKNLEDVVKRLTEIYGL